MLADVFLARGPGATPGEAESEAYRRAVAVVDEVLGSRGTAGILPGSLKAMRNARGIEPDAVVAKLAADFEVEGEEGRQALARNYHRLETGALLGSKLSRRLLDSLARVFDVDIADVLAAARPAKEGPPLRSVPAMDEAAATARRPRRARASASPTRRSSSSSGSSMAARTLEPAAAAQALLRDFEQRYDVGEAPPVPVERIASALLGLFVDEADDIRTLPGAPADQGRLSGMLDAEEMIVWIDRGEARRSPGRRRFTIAHEVGHFVLHVPVVHKVFPDRAVDIQEIEEGSSSAKLSKHRRREREANIFASELLMPEPLVSEQARATGFNLPALAKRFEVSVPAMRLRLRLLKLLPPLA